MKNLYKYILSIILITTAIYSTECVCPTTNGGLVSEEIIDEGIKSTKKLDQIKKATKDEIQFYTDMILSKYPITEERIEIISETKTEKIIRCSESITVLPDGFKWINYKKNEYKTNKYIVQTQDSFTEIKCEYCEKPDKEFSYPEGWEDSSDLYYKNECAQEELGTEKQCEAVKGKISISRKGCCYVLSCFSCKKENESFEELLEYQEVVYEWNNEEDLTDKCREEDGQAQKEVKDCIEKYRCVKDKEIMLNISKPQLIVESKNQKVILKKKKTKVKTKVKMQSITRD